MEQEEQEKTESDIGCIERGTCKKMKHREGFNPDLNFRTFRADGIEIPFLDEKDDEGKYLLPDRGDIPDETVFYSPEDKKYYFFTFYTNDKDKLAECTKKGIARTNNARYVRKGRCRSSVKENKTE